MSLVEILVALAIGSVLIMALSGVARQAVGSHDAVRSRERVTEEARFALEQMTAAIGRSGHLLLPLADNPNTDWPEHIREQTEPPSPPIGSSTLASAVLAVRAPPTQDLDADGFPDADNDRDGRVDEDMGSDATYDGASGIVGIDDDGDGSVDEYSLLNLDDDEDGYLDEETYPDGVDDDEDGSIDEDPSGDNSKDLLSGLGNVDDDGDGVVDEYSLLGLDDDEDGSSNEDWIDALVFYVRSGSLIQRTPVPWDQNASGKVTGSDYIESILAGNVTHFRVERIYNDSSRSTLLDITLALKVPGSDESVSLRTRVLLGSAL